MAGIEIKGFEELRRNTEKLQKVIADEAIQAAEMAAAKIIQQAVERAAPRKTGQLASSIKIFKGKNKGLTATGQQQILGRLLIGPAKNTGFHGFFIEKGWTATGRTRRQRAAIGTTHGQRGTTGGRKIPPKPWFEPITRGLEKQAQDAGRIAFEEVLNRNLK